VKFDAVRSFWRNPQQQIWLLMKQASLAAHEAGKFGRS
jgi:hypothetical protein